MVRDSFKNLFLFLDSSLINTAVLPIDTTLNVNTSNINSNIDDICSLYDKNACHIEQCNISDRNDINITPCDVKINKIKTVNITSNVEFNKTYRIIDKENFSKETGIGNILNTTLVDDFAPESTLIKEKSTSECMISTNANIESDNSLTSEHNMDDSFHLSDCSVSEDSNEDELRDNTNHTSINKNTLNITTSLNSSKINICDDRDMYVEASDSVKLKLSMCPYCKKLQSQFTRHLELVHKTEEDVKKFCFLPKGK